MKGAVNFEKNDEYYTPKHIVDYFFPSGVDYDPATCKEKAKEFGIENYDTIETDGLKRDWTQFEKIWINPPFTLKHKFFYKAIETYKKAHNTIYMIVPIAFLTTRRFASGGANIKCLFLTEGSNTKEALEKCLKALPLVA